MARKIANEGNGHDLPEKIEYAIQRWNREELAQIFRENLGDGKMTRFSLDQVRVPLGGGTQWTVPTLEGETMTAGLIGVVVAWGMPRAYWQERYTGESNPPDCTSENGLYGIGTPGGDCWTCPFSQWGSKIDQSGNPTRGQACSDLRFVFLLPRENLLPMLIKFPPTSVGNFDAFKMRLTSAGLKLTDVEISIKLQKVKTYSQAVSVVARRLSEEEQAAMIYYARMIAPALREKIKQEVVIETEEETV